MSSSIRPFVAGLLALLLLGGIAIGWTSVGPTQPEPKEASSALDPGPPSPKHPTPALEAPNPPPPASGALSPAPASPGTARAETRTLPPDSAQALDAFFAVRELDPSVPEGMAAEDEDARHVDALRAKASQLPGLLELLERDATDPEHTRAATLARARVHLEMGDFLGGAPVPAHLNENQATHYADAMAAKARAQYDLAHQALDGLELDDPGADQAVLELRESIEAR